MPGDSEHQRKERQFWRRSLFASWAAVVTAVAAVWFAAGAFTQARRQEVRSLRAYVSVEAAPAVTLNEDGLPGVLITAENVGQTPAYSVQISALVAIIGRGDPPIKGHTKDDCAYIVKNTGGLSLARKPFEQRFGAGLDRNQTTLAQTAVASGIYEVRADVSVCYRDVFGVVHAIQVCRRYFNEWNRTIPCQGEQDQYD